MSASSRLDREAFQQFLAVAYAVQESQIDRKSLSAVMGVERLVKNGDLDLDGAMRQIAECARNIANATGVAIALLKGDRLICRAASGSTESDIGRQVTASLTLSADTNKREILRVENARVDQRIEAAVCRQFGAQSLVIFPICQNRALVGVLEVLFNEAHVFQDAEVRAYQLMARQIELAIFQAGQTDQKQSPIVPLPAGPRAIPQAVEQGPVLVSVSSSVPAPSPQHSVAQLCPSARVGASDSARRNRKSSSAAKNRDAEEVKRSRLQRNLGEMLAVSTVLVLACWIVYHMRPVSSLRSSGPPASTFSEPQAPSKTETAPQALATVRTAAASARARKSSRPRVRRVRRGNNQVDYIGEDVTVRYFNDPPAPTRRLTSDGWVVNIGNDVTVRYFEPKPAVKTDSQ